MEPASTSPSATTPACVLSHYLWTVLPRSLMDVYRAAKNLSCPVHVFQTEFEKAMLYFLVSALINKCSFFGVFITKLCIFVHHVGDFTV